MKLNISVTGKENGLKSVNIHDAIKLYEGIFKRQVKHN